MYAIDDIVSAIRWFNESRLPLDVIVLTRGGGSLESLQAFNSEAVAKAIFASKISVLTGIGHENDTTISDLVADLRASTPTDAGKMLSDPWRNAGDVLERCQTNITTIFSRLCAQLKHHLSDLQDQIVSTSRKDLNAHAQRLDRVQTFLEFRLKTMIDGIKHIQRTFFENRIRLENGITSIRVQLATHESLFDETHKRWLKFLQHHLRLTFSKGSADSKVENVQKETL